MTVINCIGARVSLEHLTCVDVDHLRIQRVIRGFNPQSNLRNFFYWAFAKYTVQDLLLYSLNPKFSIGKR